MIVARSQGRSASSAIRTSTLTASPPADSAKAAATSSRGCTEVMKSSGRTAPACSSAIVLDQGHVDADGTRDRHRDVRQAGQQRGQLGPGMPADRQHRRHRHARPVQGQRDVHPLAAGLHALGPGPVQLAAEQDADVQGPVQAGVRRHRDDHRPTTSVRTPASWIRRPAACTIADFTAASESSGMVRPRSNEIPLVHVLVPLLREARLDHAPTPAGDSCDPAARAARMAAPRVPASATGDTSTAPLGGQHHLAVAPAPGRDQPVVRPWPAAGDPPRPAAGDPRRPGPTGVPASTSPGISPR